MLETVRGRIAALIADGATLAQVVAAEPTKEWDAKYGNPTTFFLDRAYKSLEGAEILRLAVASPETTGCPRAGDPSSARAT